GRCAKMLDLKAIRAAAKGQTPTQAVVARVARVALSHTIQTEIEAPTEAPAPDLTPANGGSEPATDVLPSVEPTPATPPPRPIPWFHLDADWRKDYAAWQAHRNTCPPCSASERTAATVGTGIRCKLGQRLHTAYESALNDATVGYNP
ncbi:MAG: hypothetical protein ACMV1D_10215, partial [Macromonas sp.]